MPTVVCFIPILDTLEASESLRTALWLGHDLDHEEIEELLQHPQCGSHREAIEWFGEHADGRDGWIVETRQTTETYVRAMKYVKGPS